MNALILRIKRTHLRARTILFCNWWPLLLFFSVKQWSLDTVCFARDHPEVRIENGIHIDDTGHI